MLRTLPRNSNSKNDNSPNTINKSNSSILTLFTLTVNNHLTISPFTAMTTILGLQQACRLSLPLQLAYMMRYIGGDDASVTRSNAYVTAFFIGTASLCVGLVHHLYIFGMQRVGMRIRIALCSMIYRKVRTKGVSYCRATLHKEKVWGISNSRFNFIAKQI